MGPDGHPELRPRLALAVNHVRSVCLQERLLTAGEETTGIFTGHKQLMYLQADGCT